jgi:hypothetical protein
MPTPLPLLSLWQHRQPLLSLWQPLRRPWHHRRWWSQQRRHRCCLPRPFPLPLPLPLLPLLPWPLRLPLQPLPPPPPPCGWPWCPLQSPLGGAGGRRAAEAGDRRVFAAPTPPSAGTRFPQPAATCPRLWSCSPPSGSAPTPQGKKRQAGCAQDEYTKSRSLLACCVPPKNKQTKLRPYLKLNVEDGPHCREQRVPAHVARVGRHCCEQGLDDLELDARVWKTPARRNYVHHLVDEQPLAGVINAREALQVPPCCKEQTNRTPKPAKGNR